MLEKKRHNIKWLFGESYFDRKRFFFGFPINLREGKTVDGIWVAGKYMNLLEVCLWLRLGNCIGNKCLPGEVLKKENYLHSENRRYSMVLRESGNLEILCGKVLIWASNTYDSKIDGLYFKLDAYKSWLYLVALGESSSTVKWILHTKDPQTYLLILENDGNVALYSSNKAWYNPSGVQPALDTYGKCSNGKNLSLLYIIVLW